MRTLLHLHLHLLLHLPLLLPFHEDDYNYPHGYGNKLRARRLENTWLTTRRQCAMTLTDPTKLSVVSQVGVISSAHNVMFT